MFRFRSRALRRTAAFLTCLVLAFPLQAAAGHAEENPTALRMAGDAIVGRPLLLVATVVGTATWIVSLPFSALGGNAMESADTLVVGPARATFLRCLGCKHSLTDREINSMYAANHEASAE